MAVPSNTQLTYSTIGRREDLSDVIYNVDPTDVPFLTGVPKATARNTLHEWQTDTLASASSGNAVIEGDDATVDAFSATTRLSNTCQISDKVASVSGTQEASLSAGRGSEMEYQLAKRFRELRRDMETILLCNQAETTNATGATGTARKLGSIDSWITTNTSNGTSGSDGSLGNTARTDGTQRAFTETLLQGVLQDCWSNGGDPDCIMVGAFNKRKMSTFTGNANRYINASDRTLVTTIDIYKSDWGDIQVIPNRFSRARDALVLQKDLWAVAYYRTMRIMDLAKTGDSEKKQIVVEYTLESRNEKGSGAVWDLSTS